MKQFIGTVVSDKMQGSAVVVIERSWRHPLYKKIVKRSKKYLVDNKLQAKQGQKVTIVETRPLSRNKFFAIKEIIK